MIGEVEDSQFGDVLLGIDPNTGDDLVQNANKPQRCPGWDCTFNFPKDFGILATLPATYQMLRDIQEHAVGPKVILVVDESGMVNARHTQMLTKRVKKGGGTLVLIGDGGQIPPVEGSAPFQSLVGPEVPPFFGPGVMRVWVG